MDVLSKHGVKTTQVVLNESMDDDFTSFLLYGAYPFSFMKAVEYMKEGKKKIVYDLDDALGLIEQSNPFYYAVKKDLGSSMEILEQADHVTVSTQAMKEYVTPHTTAPITIVPNCYVESEWNFPQPYKRQGLKIGFAGSPTHMIDLLPLLPVIKKLQDKYNFTFTVFGFAKVAYAQWYKDHRYISDPSTHKDLELFDKLLSEIKFEWIPFVDYDIYPQVLTKIGLDIGLCPLRDTPFDRCRSASKAMEYTLSGALALASNVEAYKSDLSSVLVDDNEWEEALEYFITHEMERKLEHSAHLDWVKQNRNIETQVETLKSIYQ